MVDLVKNRRDYRRVLLSNMISQLGDWLSYIAISLLTVSSGEGGLALASAYLVHTLPNALMAPLSGRIADRFDRKQVMIASAVIASLCTALMCVAASQNAIWILQALTFTRTCISSFGMTARQAATPSLVERDELYTANSLSSMVWSTLFAAGVALGGVLAATVGPTLAIGIDSASFLIAALVILGLPALPPSSIKVDQSYGDLDIEDRQKEPLLPEGEQSLLEPSMSLTPQSGLWACWRFARQDPKLAASLLAKCPLGVINSAGWMTLTLLASLTFNDKSGAILGLFHASRAIGTGVGPILFKRVWPNSAVQSSIWSILATLGILWSEQLWLTLFSLLCFGALLGYTWVRSSALVQRYAPSEALGRLTAFDYSASIVCQSISILMVGIAYDLGYGLSAGVYVVIFITLALGVWLIRLERSAQV